MKPILLAAALLLPSLAHSAEPEEKLTPAVIAAMREVHSGFDGTPGYVAQFGDSITYSMAFWSVMDWADPASFITADDGLPKAPAKAAWKNTIKGARDKGVEFANMSGWKTGQLLAAVGPVLEREKPEVAIIMIGTNDIRSGEAPESYFADLAAIVEKCLAAHCIPVLNTIPPRKGAEKEAESINVIVRELAKKNNLPLVDFHAAILQLRPGDTWQGTLISGDGVHPTGGKSNDYSPANLATCGYALRNWLNFLTYRQLHFEVLEGLKVK